MKKKWKLKQHRNSRQTTRRYSSTVRDPLNEYILNIRKNRVVGGGGINSGFVAEYMRRGLSRPGYTVKLQNNLVYK